MFQEILDNSQIEYIYTDGMYKATFIIIGYPHELNFLELILPTTLKYTNSMIIKKQDIHKVLRELSYNLSSVKANYKELSKNRIDYNKTTKYNEDMINLRKDIQINLENIYKTYNIVCISSVSKEELNTNIKIIREKLYSKNFKSIKLNFRHLQGYLSTLSTDYLDKNLEHYNKLLTSSNLVSLFPFVTKNIIDKNGILIGKTISNQIVLLDVFDNKYLNSNMCIFGSSGTGKSFFTKILILRNYINDINGYIFDIEGEYSNITLKCNGTVFNLNSLVQKLNILEFNNNEIFNNFLLNKCNKITKYLYYLETNLENKEYILNNNNIFVELFKKVYNKFNITEDIQSLYENDKNYIESKFKTNDKFPVLDDVIKYLEDNKKKIKFNKEEYNKIIDILINIKSKYPIFNGHTNININSEMVSFNYKQLDKSKIPNVSKVIFDIIEEKIMLKKNKNLIYIDEFWKFILYDKELADNILQYFKTIRKNNAGLVVITQDICDIFSNNELGKTIINNSCFTALFKMEYSEREEINKSGMGFNHITDMLQTLKKGNCILKVNSNIVKLDIIASDTEKDILKEKTNDNNSNR